VGAQFDVTGLAAMETDDYLLHGYLPLTRNNVLRIEDGREMLICARSGCIWITQERDRRDIVLEAGQRFRISRGGRTLIMALRRSVIALASPYEKCFARRVDLVPDATARAVAMYEGERGLRGGIAALKTRLRKAWVGLYAAPPRSIGQIV
jgi:hypothetical protein